MASKSRILSNLGNLLTSDNQVPTSGLTVSGVTAGTYGSSTAIPVITVDDRGRITVATTATVSGGGGGSGSVTSVGLSVPSFLSVTNSPITGSGTLAVTYSGTPLPVANGGTGTATPGLIAGSNIIVTGTWPNQTIISTASGGGGGGGGGGTYVTRTFTGDGTTATYTVSSGVTVDSALVTENGITQTPTTDYTITGTTLTFATAPAAGELIQIRELASGGGASGAGNAYAWFLI